MGTALVFALEILKWLPVAETGIRAGWDALKWGNERIQKMVAEKRDPTEAEWAELKQRRKEMLRLLLSDTE